MPKYPESNARSFKISMQAEIALQAPAGVPGRWKNELAVNSC